MSMLWASRRPVNCVTDLQGRRVIARNNPVLVTPEKGSDGDSAAKYILPKGNGVTVVATPSECIPYGIFAEYPGVTNRTLVTAP
jgi:hypothetical protein